MMDFLRRLAPLHASDGTRAVAVVPARFASEGPLRATIAPHLPAQRVDEDESSLSHENSSPPALTDLFAAQRQPFAGEQPSHAIPHLSAMRPTRPATALATSSTPAPADAPEIAIARPLAMLDRPGANPQRAQPVGTVLQGRAGSITPSPGLQGVVASSAQAQVTLPLSQAVLAQRTLPSRSDPPVVHVTIGRIDVVANPAPAPAVRPNPVPRQTTVTLAEYLRGGNGSRR